MPSHSGPRAIVERYHDGTKHHFHAFAQSLGYLDWASQPRPFREFAGSPAFPLYPAPSARAGRYVPRPRSYDQLFEASEAGEPLTAAAIGDVLRHALGLSAWKQYGDARWSLRVNPSSGNLHPTEAYVICGAIPEWSGTPSVYHYASDRHALELRCRFDASAWSAWAEPMAGEVALVALTSIHWREAWKYGERAFRYCQHDLGHAIAALGLAAALAGWRVAILPAWSHRAIASATGIDRDEDFVEAEREEPGCILAMWPGGGRADLKVGPYDVVSRQAGASRHVGADRQIRPEADLLATAPVGPDPQVGPKVEPLTTAPVGADLQVGPGPLVEAIRAGQWSGRASQLSEDHVQWTFIDEVAEATEDRGRADARWPEPAAAYSVPRANADVDARAVILRRRSAVALDGVSRIGANGFFAMLSRTMPGPHPPWSALWWRPCIHLALFVHRVDGVPPGVYVLAREAAAMARLKAACTRDFLWMPAHDSLPFACLAPGDGRALAARVSCDQDIAGDGFFSLGMIADFDASLDAYGPSFYRHLFWESGVVGQVLYLEAEAAGARATGIGCFFDDPVHDVLGLEGHAFQSLYHFTVGTPVEDTRLTTEPGYEWELPTHTSQIPAATP